MGDPKHVESSHGVFRTKVRSNSVCIYCFKRRYVKREEEYDMVVNSSWFDDSFCVYTADDVRGPHCWWEDWSHWSLCSRLWRSDPATRSPSLSLSASSSLGLSVLCSRAAPRPPPARWRCPGDWRGRGTWWRHQSSPGEHTRCTQVSRPHRVLWNSSPQCREYSLKGDINLLQSKMPCLNIFFCNSLEVEVSLDTLSPAPELSCQDSSAWSALSSEPPPASRSSQSQHFRRQKGTDADRGRPQLEIVNRWSCVFRRERDLFSSITLPGRCLFLL